MDEFVRLSLAARNQRTARSWSSLVEWGSTLRRELEAELRLLRDASSGSLESSLLGDWCERLRDLGPEPSIEDWSRMRPLRLAREEDWSDWLAFLLEQSRDGGLARGILAGSLAPDGTDFAAPRVQREVPTKDRAYRADLLVVWRTGGATAIEVKIGDLKLAKTDETARGVGATHSALLLPGRDVAAWNDQAPLSSRTLVRTWEQVAVTLRRVLWGRAESPAWRGWALAFVGKIEQELLQLPVLERCTKAPDPRRRTEPVSALSVRAERLRLMTQGKNDADA